LHTQNLGTQITDLIHGLGQFDSPAFAPTTGMNLGLNDPPTGTGLFLDLGRSTNSFLRGFGQEATLDGHTVLGKQGFALVFVNVHGIWL
jgi:hypothetical protein